MNDQHDNAETDRLALERAHHEGTAHLRHLDTDEELPTTIYLRGVEWNTAQAVKRRAKARGITMAEYVRRLVWLHSTMLRIPEPVAPEAAHWLRKHDLGPVED